jgi:uncharacterized membrane protein YbhN (UPF0104 family)
MTNWRKIASRAVPWVFYALIAVFAYNYLTKLNWSALNHLNLNFWWVAASGICAIALRYWYASIWMFLMRRLGAHTKGHHGELYKVYAKSWLGRYLPGGATWILGKIYFASKLGLSKLKLGISSFLEGGLQIIALLISASLILAFDPTVAAFGSQWSFILLAGTVLGLLSVYPPIFNRLTSLLYRVVRKTEIGAENLPSTSTITLGIGSFFVSTLLNGLCFFFVVLAVAPGVGIDRLFYILGCASLANALSMLAIFAPAGLGVRETVQLTMLSGVIGPELALVVTVLDRLFSIAMDLVFWLSTAGIRTNDRLEP